MNYPYLPGVIDAKDVKEKGTGFRAKYMAWAKVAQLFNEHCKGWTFHLRPNNETLLWQAPEGAFLVFYFKDPDGKEYSDFPYAVMDNRNNPIPLVKITARDIADSARRGFCAACAFQFSLGYELWAQEEISTHTPIVEPIAVANPVISTQQQEASQLTKANRKDLLEVFEQWAVLNPEKFGNVKKQYSEKFPDFEGFFKSHVRTLDQANFLNNAMKHG